MTTDVDRTVVGAPTGGAVTERQDLGGSASTASGPGSSYGRDAGPSSVAVRLAAGDRSAAADFYDATARQVFAVARALTGDVRAAEEVLVETYVEVWRQAPQRFGQADASDEGVRAWVVYTAALLAGRRHR